ncbi:phage holin family protein [Salmonella enterica]|nr:phage holin family protein [Salmonella enterica]
MYRMDKIREWFSYSFGGLTAMGGILSLNDWAVIIGILLDLPLYFQTPVIT